MAQSVWEHAQNYVGNVGADYHMAGICQLELLKRSGLKPDHHVLEIGCGALVAGRPLIQFLNADRYVGIEPNTWLVDAARDHFPDMRDWFRDKRPIFLPVTDFNAAKAARKFDYMLSHSVLSHAAHWQLPLFLSSVADTLAPYGQCICSIRFYDLHGTLMGDSLHDEWQYPGVTHFSLETVQEEARKVGLAVAHRPDLRQFFTTFVPTNFHDWIVIDRSSAFAQPIARPTETSYGRPDRNGLELGDLPA